MKKKGGIEWKKQEVAFRRMGRNQAGATIAENEIWAQGSDEREERNEGDKRDRVTQRKKPRDILKGKGSKRTGRKNWYEYRLREADMVRQES